LHVTADEDVRSRGFSSRRVLCASHKNEYVLFSCVFFSVTLILIGGYNRGENLFHIGNSRSFFPPI
jgi:hypothetical protein